MTYRYQHWPPVRAVSELMRNNREHPDQQPHSLVRQLHRLRPDITPESGEDGREDHQDLTSTRTRSVPVTQSHQDGSQSAAPTVRVKLHGSATLPCSENCSGVVRWTVSHKPTEVLAECNQTSCRSVKEGYQMIHDQYLNGDLSLIITDADFSKRGLYTCDCDDIDLSDVDLQIEHCHGGTQNGSGSSSVTSPALVLVEKPNESVCGGTVVSTKMNALNTLVQITAGESLVMKLDIPDPVEVVYNSRGASGALRVHICTVNKLLLQCELEYRHRVSLRSYLELRQMSPSDSGLYTVMDLQNNVLHTYTVTVKDDQQSLDRDPTPDPLWMTILSKFSLYISLLILGLALVVVVRQPRRNLRHVFQTPPFWSCTESDPATTGFLSGSVLMVMWVMPSCSPAHWALTLLMIVTDILRAVMSSMSPPVSAAPSADGCTTQDYMHTDRYHDCP
ncbi:hypothetical protein NFI96_008720 [Prochilodus magdalenae]|nr:hypothetical protein NFI96_008720 [Prochilodus magdalenae]